MEGVEATEQTLFRYKGLPPAFFEDTLPTNEELDRTLRRFAEEMQRKAEESAVLTKVQGMFTSVMGSIEGLKTHVDAQITEVREEVKGIRARVVVLEGEPRKRSMTPPAMRAISTYKPTDTGSFKLTDFELHDLHAEAATWRAIKAFCRAAAIPVAAALMLGLLAWVAVHIWR